MVRMSEKTFQSDIKRTQNQIVAENSAETCQRDAADASVPADAANTDIEDFAFIHAQLITTISFSLKTVSVGGLCLRALRALRGFSGALSYCPSRPLPKEGDILLPAYVYCVDTLCQNTGILWGI